MDKRKTGLFFGSFNPVHVGHMILANFMATSTDLREVWMVVSPQNPFKERASLARDHDRLHLVELAIGDTPNLKASNVEFSMSKPSYTIDTLAVLRDKHPQREFALIMGTDNLASLRKWKNADIILRDYNIHVYNRPGYPAGELADHERVTIYDAPLMHLSATYVRKAIKAGKSVRYLVPEAAAREIEITGLYQ
ncbi:nicotinate (nicotinamide) nucleotide adenylyltransferase [Neolewinella antarctica]|uniref:Probable nicotinate-nucleotide adenylyltransferase n=1 Tax=Neolewinella antarctica TaxID=442734 RepID=A0ABX0XEL8_9BACT|nr:nicotinate (nicotinamide) nucleotide adenylyltransferase [Neolewinella antarctica]NJC27328.1 nicotinate-nucleotide adenylyltransferase [Neolewinella antarctica]